MNLLVNQKEKKKKGKRRENNDGIVLIGKGYQTFTLIARVRFPVPSPLVRNSVVEYLTFNQGVGSSNLPEPTKIDPR